MAEETINITDEINYLRSLIESTENQISSLERLLSDMGTTLSVVSSRDLFESEEKKINIGSGIYIDAVIKKPDRFLVPIGSDVYAEFGGEDVEKRLKDNMKQITDTLDTLYLRRKELSSRYDSLIMLLQRASQQPEKGKDV